MENPMIAAVLYNSCNFFIFNVPGLKNRRGLLIEIRLFLLLRLLYLRNFRHNSRRYKRATKFRY